MLFVQNKYQIVSGDEERIAIDHINVVTQTGDAKHTLCKFFFSLIFFFIKE